MSNVINSDYESLRSVLSGVKINYYYLSYRRLFEQFIIIILSPFWLVVIVIISVIITVYYLKSPIYLQERIGFLGKPFIIYKLRTTKHNNYDCTDYMLESKNKLGKLLRNHHLDELPQLFNILIGNMSLIGPRPFPPDYDKELFMKIPQYSIKYYIKPGITGLWQIAPTNKRFHNYDLKYLNSMNPLVDLEIIKQTIKRIINGKIKS
ncbi:sugar transferase [Candidatus Kapabacteria bacterium]|nr:sugar transferase [Candidatus Kapabacteria bacterium]